MNKPTYTQAPEPQTFLKALTVVLALASATFGFLLLVASGCILSAPPDPDAPAYNPWIAQAGWSGAIEAVDKVNPEYTPQWTPDGSEIIFSAGKGFNFKRTAMRIASLDQEGTNSLYRGSIYAVDTVDGSLRRISGTTGPNELEYSANLSKDGSTIAYVTSRHFDDGPARGWKERNFEIERLDFATLERRRLTNDAETDRQEKTDTFPQISPDGQRILYVKRSVWREEIAERFFLGQKRTDILFATDKDSPEIQTVYPREEHLTGRPSNRGTIYEPPRWSPDGTKIAFRDLVEFGAGEDVECHPQSRFDILYTIKPDGSELTEVMSESPNLRRMAGPAAWSPDGSLLAIVKINITSEEIPPLLSLIRSDGSGEHLTTELDTDARLLKVTNTEWSPDGQRILISTVKAKKYPSDAGSTTFVVNRDGTEQTSMVGKGSYASWSPDGSKIALLGGWELPYVTEKGKHETQQVAILATSAPDGSEYRPIFQRFLVANPKRDR